MQRRTRFAALALTGGLTVWLQACATAPRSRFAFDPGLLHLASHMAGSFSSQEQATRDADFRDIRLHMVRIWPDRRDGIWLYVEQAAATTLDQPYRQRVYRVTHLGADLYESRVYEFPEPMRFAGAWEQPSRLAGLTDEELTDRDGCALLLRRLADGSFAGSTLGRLCVSTHRGATYATSEATISAGRLVSWDRGWDASGKQVWGAEKGGYEFVRLESYPLE